MWVGDNGRGIFLESLLVVVIWVDGLKFLADGEDGSGEISSTGGFTENIDVFGEAVSLEEDIGWGIRRSDGVGIDVVKSCINKDGGTTSRGSLG